ncbi:MAG: tRNA pseudouridine(55) synthase TruB [Acidobacteria bacterium]|nr:tRNA pseudouridine(55) synthase TruB [Acidobacteriota bacterium]MBU4306477.1 tRNA pseudouridine(55) synthase TruB [Acidobacteriota bacterium]MBU4404334.1 tRNA pseudouridine(55) synthase TruB [Acidobacteriota bacterium]MCG2812438.1 tRNA pseudouridine(55) synthase TruB [Candidatus Aminicenantes bacterium]
MIHGLIAVNKEKGVSSHALVTSIRRLFKTKKAGHFGTLDPTATGLLLIALGHATRFFDFYVKQNKLYSGLIRFGFATSTYDSEGKPQKAKQSIDLQQINLETLLAGFRGKQMQMPPAFSAKKFKGKPLYTYARRQQEVPINPVEVSIHELTGRVIDHDTLEFRALTSSGTYIRSLAHDLGQKVGVGAYLLELKRERIGSFSLEQAKTLAEIATLAETGSGLQAVIPIESLLDEYPKMIVNQTGRRCICNGMALKAADILKIFPAPNTAYFRIFDDEGKLLAIAQKEAKSMSFKPYLVIPESEPGN